MNNIQKGWVLISEATRIFDVTPATIYGWVGKYNVDTRKVRINGRQRSQVRIDQLRARFAVRDAIVEYLDDVRNDNGLDAISAALGLSLAEIAQAVAEDPRLTRKRVVREWVEVADGPLARWRAAMAASLEAEE